MVWYSAQRIPKDTTHGTHQKTHGFDCFKKMHQQKKHQNPLQGFWNKQFEPAWPHWWIQWPSTSGSTLDGHFHCDGNRSREGNLFEAKVMEALWVGRWISGFRLVVIFGVNLLNLPFIFWDVLAKKTTLRSTSSSTDVAWKDDFASGWPFKNPESEFQKKPAESFGFWARNPPQKKSATKTHLFDQTPFDKLKRHTKKNHPTHPLVHPVGSFPECVAKGSRL